MHRTTCEEKAVEIINQIRAALAAAISAVTMAVKSKDQKLGQKARWGFLRTWFVRLSVLAFVVSACAYLDSIRVRR